MRKLFVPACLCLLAFSTPAGSALKKSQERFSSIRTPDHTAQTRATDGSGSQTSTIEPPHEAEAVSVVAPVDSPVTIPAQNESASTPVLEDGGVTAPLPNDNGMAEATPLPKPKPEIKHVVHRSTEEVCDSLTKAANNHGLPVAFFIRLLFQESRFNPGAVSHAGAQGVAQFMPGTASDMGLDNPFDPLQAIPASARLLRNLFEKFGNFGLAAAAYNAGPKRIENWLSKKGKLPEETQGYVKIITGRPAENWKTGESGTPAVKLPRRAPCQEAAGLLAWNGPDQIPVPSIAPHRKPKEPLLVAIASKEKTDVSDGKQSKTLSDVKIAGRDGRASAVIKIADATGNLPRTEHKKEAVQKTAAKKETAKKEKSALQLAARKQTSKPTPAKKVQVSQR